MQFLTATDTNRKKFLIDLLHLDAYVELFEIFKEASRESATKITELSTEATTIEKWLSNNKLESTIVLPMLDLDINTEDDEKSFRSLSIELENISEKNKKILQNNQYKDMLSRIDINQVQSALQQLPPAESYDKYQSDVGQLNAGIKSANGMLDKLLRLEDKCPTCEQDIDTEFKNELVLLERNKLSKLDSDKDFNEDMIRQIKRNNNARGNLSKAEKEWEDLYRGIDSDLPSQILDKEALADNLVELETKLRAAKTELAKIAKENEARTKSNTRIEIIQAQTDGFIEKLNKAKAVLAQQAQLDSNLDVLKKAFSTNGLLAYKIENLVKELEELTNQYLAELSDGRFTLQFIVSNDKLNVQITDNEVIVDILALSSGELARVIDDAGREKLVEVLLAEDLNTYAVSHGWTHPLLEKIEVVKQGNISALDK